MRLRLLRCSLAAIGLCLWFDGSNLLAQQQYAGLCAPVTIVLSQTLTLERIGFQATLQITDNDPNNPITGFSANLTFENPSLSTNGTVNDSSSLFFVQPPTLQNITAIDGTGVIQPGQTAQIGWFLIPTVNAGGTNPLGLLYRIGANLGGQINGTPIPATALTVLPATITVQPDAQLQITYFQPRDVTGMDPFTGLGAPIPFDFGVIVQNVGYGPANNMVVSSQQPQITQNLNNLLLVAQLLGSSVNDAPLSNASLTMNLGTVQPGHAVKGDWSMIVTLSGTFLSVSATYTHSTALGGSETSLIKSVNAYLFLHEVLDDQPGRDNIRDFLTDTSGTLDPVANLIPDSLYESDGGVYPVNVLSNTSVTGSGLAAQVNLNATVSGWGYMRMADPNQARLPIVSVVRSDGKILNTNNFWTSIHFEPISNFKDTYLNIFDLVDLGAYSYAITYTNPPAATNAPVTTLMFAGSSTYTNGVYYVTPQTQMYFLSQDVLPVTIYDSLDGAPFSLALPFSLPAPGTYQLSYYAADTVGNQEQTHTATLVLPGPGSLGFASATLPSQPIYNLGGTLSVRPGLAPITFQASPNPNAVNAQIDIFRGVIGWVAISNVPSSPTASTTASLNITGQNVDYYIYNLNSNGWSSDQAVSQPLSLSSLPLGTNVLLVLGRSQYGTYLDPSNAVAVSWVVSNSAPPTIVSGAPATPTHTNGLQLTISGRGVTNYAWTIDGGYYRAPTNISAILVLTNLQSGSHTIGVLGEVAGVTQPTNIPTTVSWTVNPLYGYDMSALTDVLSLPYTNIGSAPITYSWNGLSSNGVVQPPGWYTVRVTLSDALGDTNFFVGLVDLNALMGATNVLAGSSRGPINPRTHGRWTVWQDQSDGNWEIYARDITQSSNPILQLTHTNLSQENPRTDGRYVVWQAQAPNGSWDIYLQDLEGAGGPQSLTATPDNDEIDPAIDWPWVVFQSRPTDQTNAPWLLNATNLLTGSNFLVSPTTQDEIDPDVQSARVVWQDFRDQGPGEIYFCDLQTQQVRRITTNIYEQFNPAIDNNWIVWADNRNIAVNIYGFDLLRNAEFRLTTSSNDQSQPVIDGSWVLCMDNGLGAGTGNPRLINLPSLLSVPLTSTSTLKSFPGMADGAAVWQETIGGQSQIVSAVLPSLQPAFVNRNTVVITPAMVSYAQTAYGLLSLWATNGVQSVTQYSSLVPQIATQTASINNGVASGENFSLVAGGFLWMKFNSEQVLDLGVNTNGPIPLAPGANVFGYSGFPEDYNAYTLLNQVGLGNAQSVRMLDAEAGRWRVALVQNGAVLGDNFQIPPSAVLMISVSNSVNFTPYSP